MPLRILPALGGCVVAVVLLTSCTASRSEPPVASTAAAPPSAATTTPPAPTPAPTGSTGISQEQFVSTVKAATQRLGSLSDGTVLQLGRQVCDSLRRGEDAGAVALALSRSSAAPGLDQTDVALLLGASVAALCPQYRGRLG